MIKLSTGEVVKIVEPTYGEYVNYFLQVGTPSTFELMSMCTQPKMSAEHIYSLPLSDGLLLQHQCWPIIKKLQESAKMLVDLDENVKNTVRKH